MKLESLKDVYTDTLNKNEMSNIKGGEFYITGGSQNGTESYVDIRYNGQDYCDYHVGSNDGPNWMSELDAHTRK